MFSQIVQARFKKGSDDNSSNELADFLKKNQKALIKNLGSSRGLERHVKRLLNRAKALKKTSDLESYILKSLKRLLGVKNVSESEKPSPSREASDQRAIPAFRQRRLPSTHGPGAEQE